MDEDFLGGFGLGVFVGSFDEFAGLGEGVGAAEGEEARAFTAPAVLGGLESFT